MSNRFSTFLVLLAGLTLVIGCSTEKKEKTQRALIHTDLGDITIELYNSTPKHRDNFIKLAKSGFYDGLLFHRVMDHFMIQGGDPDSKNAGPGVMLGMGGPGYEIDAEIGAPHLRGALAAARNNNPAKKSSGSQFYIVTGLQQTNEDLNVIEQTKHAKYNDVQREIYLKEGGVPHLDMDYTVFGKVISGMDVVDKIGQVQTDERARPLTDIKMTIKLID